MSARARLFEDCCRDVACSVSRRHDASAADGARTLNCHPERSEGSVFQGLGRIGRVVVSVLREIFDEAAYARFLARNSMERSRESYAAFCRERQGRPPRPRCC